MIKITMLSESWKKAHLPAAHKAFTRCMRSMHTALNQELIDVRQATAHIAITRLMIYFAMEG